MKRRSLFTWILGMVSIAVIAAGALQALSGKDGGQGVTPLHFFTGDDAVEVTAQPFELVLARTYLCGMKEEERKPVPAEKLAQLLTEYNGWEIISADASKVILLKRENDISPSCKANGYFGLSGEGVLTLFNGLPSGQEVIQTFYQIDTAKMEASLPKEVVESLKKGIRVKDLAEYNSVLSTYEEFQEED
jgi:forespore regulator of the sigma-K checkpoint